MAKVQFEPGDCVVAKTGYDTYMNPPVMVVLAVEGDQVHLSNGSDSTFTLTVDELYLAHDPKITTAEKVIAVAVKLAVEKAKAKQS